MSIYAGGATAYRDTTKWLVAFLPLTALAAGAFTLGPPVIRSIQDAPSLPSWASDHWLVLVCMVVLFAGLTAILYYGAKVLSVEPTDIGDILTSPDKKSTLAAAIGSGVTAPWFLDKSSFDTALAAMANAWNDTVHPPEKDDPRAARLQLAIDALREWSVYHQIQSAFRNFRYAFIGSSLAIGVAILAAPLQLDDSIPIDKPMHVQVDVSEAGQNALLKSTGCLDPKTSSFLAVGGSWNQPALAVDGPGCAFGAVWHPHPSEIETRLSPSP
jgi:hypothetical protein